MNIVIAAECPQLWNKLHKIKIHNLLPDTKPKDIHEHIVTYLLKENGGGSDEVMVEAYHPDGNFVPLLDPRIEDDFLDAFGTRLRCIIHIQNNNSSDTTDHETKLMIKGRHFDYNPNGMEYAGKNLVIKEVVNNQDEDGTGLNVWDGSLLLARYLEKFPEKVSPLVL